MQPRLSCTLTVLAAVASCLRLDAGEGVKPRAAALVRQLGSPSFAAREAATEALREMGLRALPALERAADDADLEVRYRVRGLREAIGEIDHARRVKAFEEASEPPEDDVLPGWKRYRAEVGEDARARKLFAEMQREEGRLFRLLESGEGDFDEAVAARCLALQYRYSYRKPRKLPVGSVAALLFLASDAECEVERQTAYTLCNFVNYEDFRSAVAKGPRKAMARRLAGLWVARPGDVALSQRIVLGLRYGAPETLEVSRRMLQANGGGSQLQYAILAMGRFGGREDVRLLEPLLQDATVIGRRVRGRNPRKTMTCQARDVALATILHLTGQDPQDYGFEEIRRNETYLFAPNTAGFWKESKRESAFRKWEAWKAKQEGDAG